MSIYIYIYRWVVLGILGGMVALVLGTCVLVCAVRCRRRYSKQVATVLSTNICV